MTSSWWNADRSQAGTEVSAMVESLLNAFGRTRRRHLEAYRQVYCNRESRWYDAKGGGIDYYWRGGSKYCVTQGGVDSVHAKLALSRPRPKIMPSSRRFKGKRKAKTLQRWIDGLFRKNATDALQDDQLHDCMIYGAGVIKVVTKAGWICHERRRPGDLLTDPREETRTAVRSLFEVAACDREVIAETYGDMEGSNLRKKILDVEAPPEQDDPAVDMGMSVALDQIKVLEAWRLPAIPGGKGRHIISTGSIVLIDDPWEWDFFPFSLLRWGRDPERMWGQGMVERGLKVQAMVNHHAHVQDDAMERFVPKYMIPRQANVDATVIDRKVGQVIEYDANPHGAPSVLAPSQVSPEWMMYGSELADRWFAVTGASQMDARSEADPSLESGKAKLIQGEINKGRFYVQGKDRERACVRLAELSIKMADALYDEKGDEDQLSVPADRKSWRESVPYGDARMSGEGEEAYAIEVWPISSLSQSIPARMEEIAQLAERGHIPDMNTERELLDIPILDEYRDLASAQREAADREIDRCLDGEQGKPNSYMDLVYAKDTARNELCLAGIDDAPEEVMTALRGFIGAADLFLQKEAEAAAEAAAQAQPPMPGPMPGLAPVAA